VEYGIILIAARSGSIDLSESQIQTNFATRQDIAAQCNSSACDSILLTSFAYRLCQRPSVRTHLPFLAALAHFVWLFMPRLVFCLVLYLPSHSKAQMTTATRATHTNGQQPRIHRNGAQSAQNCAEYGHGHHRATFKELCRPVGGTYQGRHFGQYVQ
jgi:hypothetical protein